ncbi:unnamed protein product [Protopolystoma xenopodis]|uniref:Uncharacterized protein n=1 Tax=Protopolystoma xenopodis TaxID=117903 RepID=A0A448XNX7_9PLAT|nr:unnamed protein product [Protopolystoma xenopodis]
MEDHKSNSLVSNIGGILNLSSITLGQQPISAILSPGLLPNTSKTGVNIPSGSVADPAILSGPDSSFHAVKTVLNTTPTISQGPKSIAKPTDEAEKVQTKEISGVINPKVSAASDLVKAGGTRRRRFRSSTSSSSLSSSRSRSPPSVRLRRTRPREHTSRSSSRSR